MRKAVVAALGLLSGHAAFAQSAVTVYGTLDAGLWYQSKVPGSVAGRNEGAVTQLNTGGLSPSVFGMRGKESLGNGLEVTFNLESHIDASTGAQGLTSLWARAANLGVSGVWGTVKIGKQVVPALVHYAATDPRGLRESLSGLQPFLLSSAQNFGDGTANSNMTTAAFAGNAVSYWSNAGPLSYAALYSFGEKAGNASANKVVSLGATYAGPITLSGTFHESTWATTAAKSDQKYSAGAGAQVGPVNLKANYLVAKEYASDGVAYGRWHVLGAGGDYALTAQHTLTAAYYFGKNALAGRRGDKAHSLVVSDEYALSKRSTLYAQVAAVKAGDQAGIVVSLLGGLPVQGATTVVMNVGMRHFF